MIVAHLSLCCLINSRGSLVRLINKLGDYGGCFPALTKNVPAQRLIARLLEAAAVGEGARAQAIAPPANPRRFFKGVEQCVRIIGHHN